MMTGFTRIVIVLSLLRQALGTQSAPPNQVIIGLSLFLTLFVMGPERAVSYAQEHDLGLVLVDDEGRVRVVPGPEDASWSIVEGAR